MLKWNDEERGNGEMDNKVKRYSMNNNEELGKRENVTMDKAWEVWSVPKLEGTEKQALWANSIRRDFLKSANYKVEKTEELFRIPKEEYLNTIEKMINKNITAKFWIDNRNKI